ncbi:MAG: hypothetical protein BWZ02_01622 [Lentisphaerae bacterium ADurb.BinA184]|nr:MAG: hypothetical protein BWZ02_01622 [Lentisphaerae bacterium ADurb.BinA184]
MKRSARFGGVLTLGVLVAAGGLFAPAALAEGSPWYRKLAFWNRPPTTLIVTGNFARARLLAEHAQRRTGVPILLISREPAGDHLYYLPDRPETMELPVAKYLEFVEVMLRPRRVVFLGDAAYVPAEYVQRLNPAYPTLVIAGQDWIKNARELGHVLRSPALEKAYAKTLRAYEEVERQRAVAGPSAPMPAGF